MYLWLEIRTTLKHQYITRPLIITSTSTGYHMHQINGKWALFEHSLEKDMISVQQMNTYKMNYVTLKRFFVNNINIHSGQLIKYFAKLNKATTSNCKSNTNNNYQVTHHMKKYQIEKNTSYFYRIKGKRLPSFFNNLVLMKLLLCYHSNFLKLLIIFSFSPV